jgi:hypothetical protein
MKNYTIIYSVWHNDIRRRGIIHVEARNIIQACSMVDEEKLITEVFLTGE